MWPESQARVLGAYPTFDIRQVGAGAMDAIAREKRVQRD